jgi:hypothetical protein
VVSANTIDKSANYTVSCNAIQLAQAANINARIFNNIISVTATTNGTSTIRGIYLFNGTGHKVYNNLIHNILLTTGNFKAIEVRTAATAPEIFFNTISLDNSVSTSGNLTGFSEELSNTKSVLRDNLISITQTVTGTGYKAGILLASTSSVDTAISSNYNSIYVSGGSVARKGTTTATNYLTLANWQTASGEDMNSVAINPGFASLVNSVPTNVAMNNMGTSISWITTDITGAVRASTPDIGAYEFTGGAPSAPDSILGSNKVCENTAAVNYSVVPVPGAASYTWTVTGATLVSGQGTASIMIDFSNTAAMISVLASNVNGSSASVSKPVSIAALPNTNFVASPENFCETWGQVNLGGGLPSGGTYSGNAVFNNQFNPVVAGLGPQIITYSYTNSDGCTASAEDTVHVVVCTNISPVQHTPKIVFENPCLAPCTVNLDGFSSGVLVNLYSAQGILVESQQVTSSFELKQHHNPGVYFLEIVNGTGGRIVQKIVL